MRLQLISDLHLERQIHFEAVPLPEADLLILAGDVGSYQAGSELVTDDFGLGRFSPLRPESGWKRVLYVPGNHEYYDGEVDAVQDALRNAVAAQADGQVRLLDADAWTFDGVRFLGCTLWTDYSLPTPLGREMAGRARELLKGAEEVSLQDGERLFGEGGTATVYRAQHDTHGACAVKTLRERLRNDPTAAAQMRIDTSLFRWYTKPPYEERHGGNVYILIDPSKGKTKRSDRTAISVIGIDLHGGKYLLDGYCHRMKLSRRWATAK